MERAPVDDAAVERLVHAYQSGDTAALEALHALLLSQLQWLLYHEERRLALAPSVESADLRQDVWLALAESAAHWRNAQDDGAFVAAALRAVRRGLRRSIRRGTTPGGAARLDPAAGDHSAALEAVPDRAPFANPDRWLDVALAREIATRLPRGEREVLLLRSADERPVRQIAASLGISRSRAMRLLARATLRARAMVGMPPPPRSLEARVLAAVREGADSQTGKAPRVPWLEAQTGLGRRRIRATLRELGALGYLKPSPGGRAWRVVRLRPRQVSPVQDSAA